MAAERRPVHAHPGNRWSVMLLRFILALAVAGAVAAPAQAWTDPEDLSPTAANAANSRVAVNPDGDAVVVWERHDGANTRVQIRALAADGSLSATQTLSSAGQDATTPGVGIDSDGDAVVVWERANEI